MRRALLSSLYLQYNIYGPTCMSPWCSTFNYVPVGLPVQSYPMDGVSFQQC